MHVLRVMKTSMENSFKILILKLLSWEVSWEPPQLGLYFCGKFVLELLGWLFKRKARDCAKSQPVFVFEFRFIAQSGIVAFFSAHSVRTSKGSPFPFLEVFASQVFNLHFRLTVFLRWLNGPSRMNSAPADVSRHLFSIRSNGTGISFFLSFFFF